MAKISVFAQGNDYPAVKFRSFTPFPTATYPPIPSSMTTNNDSLNYISPVPTEVNRYPIITSTTGDSCAVKGFGIFSPQPSKLQTYLCSDGSIEPKYGPQFVPNNLVNVHNALGGLYWVRDRSVLVNRDIVSNLKSFLDFIKTQGCVPMLAYGYRSYEFQKNLWDSKNCAVNAGCGVTKPGYSTHQSGAAVDLFCAIQDASGNISIDRVSDKIINSAIPNKFIHPIDWDTPHFISL